MYMFDLLCVTNRRLCTGDFFLQIEKIAKASPAGIILREKDLTEADYKKLAVQVMEICKDSGVPCILHSFVKTARELNAEAIHLPLHILRGMSAEEKAGFSVIGGSCHSKEEAAEAVILGCTYITAGHIFATDCKRGAPPEGLDFLQDICESVSVPVYAIGGISPANAEAVRRAGASGCCVMSSLMECGEPAQYMRNFKIGGSVHEI